MKLAYKAVARDGKVLKGIIEASDVNEAATLLRARELLPTSISSKEQKSMRESIPFLRSIKSGDMIFFTRQLYSMISSGLTLIQSLRVLKEQIKNEKMKEVVMQVITDIEGGKSFSQALEKFPETFPLLYTSLVSAGESAGLLDKVLQRLADNLEKQEQLRATIKSALLYPVIVIIGMIGVTMVMMLFVIPQLSGLYENLNVPLPLPTQVVIGLSKFFINFWPLILIFSVLFVILFVRWHKTKAGTVFIDSLTLRLPVFGRLIEESILTEFTRTIGLLIGSGMLIVESLNQAADTSGNVHYKNAITGVARRVEKGIGIGDALSAYTLFPITLVQMVRVGEQTGKLDESFLRVAAYYEREVEQTVKNLTTAMEPIIMVVLGVGVCFLILAVITPIYSYMSYIQ